MIKDVFKLLTTIVIQAIPQLQHEYRDLTDLVKSLIVNNGELIVDYYLRAVKIQNESTLPQDRKI